MEVDEDVQDEFFERVEAQLASINKFFRKEEIGIQYTLSELDEKVYIVTPIIHSSDKDMGQTNRSMTP